MIDRSNPKKVAEKTKPAAREFRAAMADACVTALWERKPTNVLANEIPHIWQWETLDPLLDAAVAETRTQDEAERRVLVLSNPAYRDLGLDCASINLMVNLQVIMPGESARPHRHSMNALRFVLEANGATTLVGGKACPMEPGDMILTPGWTWHEHVNEGASRAVWVDALDVPLHEHFDIAVFEPGPTYGIADLPPDGAFTAQGLTPEIACDANGGSPMFQYPWTAAAAALAQTPLSSDGSRRLRYTNPLNGEAAIATLDCHLVGLSGGDATLPYRSNANTVCVVVEGEGVSRIGNHSLAWGPRDIFTLPRDHPVNHEATSENAIMFQVTDREILRRLNLLKEEACN